MLFECSPCSSSAVYCIQQTDRPMIVHQTTVGVVSVRPFHELDRGLSYKRGESRLRAGVRPLSTPAPHVIPWLAHRHLHRYFQPHNNQLNPTNEFGDTSFL